MKKIVFLALLLVCGMGQAWAYANFGEVCPSGQTIYYYTMGTEVAVTFPGVNYGYSGYTEPSGDVIIPSTVTHDGVTYTVTRISDRAMKSLGGLTSVTIPNTVTYIGYEAFAYSGLTSVTFGSSLETIGQEAFKNCNQLTSLTIPNSVTTIVSQAFMGCSRLTSVTMSNSLTHIGTEAFYGCGRLTTITVPSTVTSVGSLAFCRVRNVAYTGSLSGAPWGSASLNGYVEGDWVYADNTKTTLRGMGGNNTAITIPSTVSTIANKAFEDAYITSVTIGDAVTSIGTYAFMDCNSLTSVTLGSGLTQIGQQAFSTNALTQITCHGVTPPTLGSNAFRNQSAVVTVPCSCIDAYQTAWGSYFTNIQDSQPYGITLTSQQPDRGTVEYAVDPSCQRVVITAVPTPGNVFKQWSDGNTTNPRTIELTQDVNLSAQFQYVGIDFYFASMDTNLGTVTEESNPNYIGSLWVGEYSSSSYYAPFNNYYRYSTNECLYLASEIGRSGQIDTISFFVAQASSLSCTTLNIYMGTTSQTSLSGGWVGLDSLQLVYAASGSKYIGSNAGWESYPLTNPFEYDGTSNLLVVVCRQSSSYTSSLKYACDNSTGMCRYRQNDNDPAYGTLAGTASGSLNKRAAIMLGSINGPNKRSYGITPSLLARPKEGYRFTGWNDRCPDNPRTLTLTQDTAVVAYFGPQIQVEQIHDTLTMHDTLRVQEPVHDTLYQHQYYRDSTLVYGICDTVWRQGPTPTRLDSQVLMLVGGDTLDAATAQVANGTEVQLLAVPRGNAQFVRWSDGNTDNPRTVVLHGMPEFTAVFEER